MPRPMDPDERRAFLAAGTRTGILATVRADGRPHAVPIWFVVDGDDLVFNTGAETVKGRNLRRDPRAVITVDDGEPPFSYVSVEGRVEIGEELAEVRRWATAIGGRYMGPERAEEMGARNGVPGELVVRLRPDRILAWAGVAD